MWSQSGLIQANDGKLYGATSGGGAYGHGTVFRIDLKGKLTTLHSFNWTDGAYPDAVLMQAADGNFYGTTNNGGAYGDGAVFKITPAGNLTTLYSFCSQSQCTDGAYPVAGLVQATDGNFYGTTLLGGDPTCGSWDGCGTVFQLTAGGTLTTLHRFQGTDGAYPLQGLLQGTNGRFYGTTAGRTYCCMGIGDGTIFSLDMGLGPFVAFVRNSGRVGSNVQILGQGFTGTTGVSFNGTTASFAVKSDTYLTATVPQGATTGFVTVTTPSGTLQSNVMFQVRP